MKIGIVAFAFGHPQNIPSNKLIAKIATQQALDYMAPIFTQLDVSIDSEHLDVEYAFENVGGYPPPTLQIAQEAVKWAKRRDVTDIIVVAAMPHMWRCLRDLRDEAYMNTEASLRIVPFVNWTQYKLSQWFCEESTQPWTRSWTKWSRRDFILRMLPFCVYRRIVG
jgi:hypothetical protein